MKNVQLLIRVIHHIHKRFTYEFAIFLMNVSCVCVCEYAKLCLRMFSYKNRLAVCLRNMYFIVLGIFIYTN